MKSYEAYIKLGTSLLLAYPGDTKYLWILIGSL